MRIVRQYKKYPYRICYCSSSVLHLHLHCLSRGIVLYFPFKFLFEPRKYVDYRRRIDWLRLNDPDLHLNLDSNH